MSFIQKQQSVLLEMQATLEARIRSNSALLCAKCEDRSSEAKADEFSIKQNINAQLEQDKSQLQQTIRSLNLINSDRYGVCFTCKEDIPQERLIAAPLAVRCIDCS